MDLLSIIRLMIRRWAVVVPVLLLTFGAVIYLMANRATDYSMSGSYLLVSGEVLNPPSARVEPPAAADALRSQLLQRSVKQQLIDEGLSGDYSVTVSDTGTSLSVVIRAEAAEIVLDTAVRLVDLAPELLAEAYDESAATISVRSLTDLSDDTNISPEGEGDGQRFVVTLALLVGPGSSDSGNPFPANLGTVRSLTRLADSVEFANGVGEDTSLTSYAVTGEVREVPIVDITVTAASGDGAREGYAYVRDAIAARLNRLQDDNDVENEVRTSMRHVVEPADVEVNPASVIRPVAGIVVLGGGLAVALAALAETIMFSGRLRGALSWAGWDRRPTLQSTNGDGDRRRPRRKRGGGADVDADTGERDVDLFV